MLLAALFLSAGIFTATNLQEKKQVSDLTLANIEAMTNNVFFDWWDSPTHDCMAIQVWEYKCYMFKDIPRSPGDVFTVPPVGPNDIYCGMFQTFSVDCVSGSSTAHCWDC